MPFLHGDELTDGEEALLTNLVKTWKRNWTRDFNNADFYLNVDLVDELEAEDHDLPRHFNELIDRLREEVKAHRKKVVPNLDNEELEMLQVQLVVRLVEELRARAFTTYPCIVYKDPEDIPSDYYTAGITQHTSKPIAYSEAGWFRVGFVGWDSSPEEQARFVALYIEKTRPLKPELLVWSFLYDQEVAEPFTSMGLLGKFDSTSPAWEAWLKP